LEISEYILLYQIEKIIKWQLVKRFNTYLQQLFVMPL